MSDNGTLVYHGGGQVFSSRSVELMVVDPSGRGRQIPGAPLEAASPRVSPDGRTIAVATVTAAGVPTGVLLIDAATGARQRLAERPASGSVAWTSDGGRLLFLRDSGASRELVARASDRSSEDRVLVRDNARGLLELSAGRAIGVIALRGTLRRNRDIYLARTDSPGVIRPLVATAADEGAPALSPDGRWIAYTSTESGAEEVYVQPIPGPGPRLQVSVNGGSEAQWAPDGRTLYYRAPGWVLRAGLAGTPLQVTHRDTVFADQYERRFFACAWDIFPSGREFLMLKAPQSEARSGVTVVLNWQQLRGLRAQVQPGQR